MAYKKREKNSGALKIPPQALDVERTVLGSALIDNGALVTAVEKLEEESFYSTSHKYIFSCIQDMFQSNIPVDTITLTEELRKREKLEAAGTEAYISELVENIATSANIEYHTEILKSKAILRKLISTAAEITTECFSPDADSKELLDSSENKMFQIGRDSIGDEPQAMKDLVPHTFEEISQIGKDGGLQGIKTGFTKMDEMTTGLHQGDLVIVAGRPGMGKTSFAINIALNTAVHAEKPTPVAIFSLEMSKIQLVQRMLCSESRVDMNRLRSGKLSKTQLKKIGQSASPLWEAPIFIDDTAGINIIEIKAKARRLKAKENIGLIIIDYLQLMNAVSSGENRQQEISTISRSLKVVAKELNLPVIALSQLSRAVEQRGGDRRPQLSDLRESGAIEQDADLVLFVFREHKYKPEDETLEKIAEIIIGKQRNGPVGNIKVSFIPKYTNFSDLEMNLTEDHGF